MKEYFYTYLLIGEDGRLYIGVRTSLVPPHEDVKYNGSFSDRTFVPAKKIILKSYRTREQAYGHERELHIFFQVHKNDLFANLSIAGGSDFFKKGPHTEKVRKRISQSHLGVPLSDEHKIAISNNLKDKPKSAEHKQKLSESRRKYLEDPSNLQSFKESRHHKIIQWYHPEHGSYTCSQTQLIELLPDLKLHITYLSKVFRKIIPQYRGWTIIG